MIAPELWSSLGITKLYFSRGTLIIPEAEHLRWRYDDSTRYISMG